LREIIFELDNNFRFSFVNPAWSKILGYSIEQTISKQLYHFLGKDFKNECHIKLIQFMKDETSQYHFECVFEGQDKQQYWLDVELNKIVLNNKLIGYWGSMENITLRKNSEKKLIASIEKEKQLIELKARFVNMASHEFRTPLSSIRSSTELIKIYGQKYEMLATQFHQYGLDKKLDHILSDVDRITMLISDILTIGKIESGNVSFNPVRMDFVSFIKHYIDNEGYRFTSTHQLNLKAPSAKVDVNLDVKLIIHTLNNIFSNAAKYSENNTNIDIEILKKKNMVQLSIQDKGIGIPPEDLPYMFDSFFRSKNAELIPGTGLGLPIAKYFIELHGGSIQIKSKLDKGTKITVELPCV
jgi:PAS domain S-box-containing protein